MRDYLLHSQRSLFNSPRPLSQHRLASGASPGPPTHQLGGPDRFGGPRSQSEPGAGATGQNRGCRRRPTRAQSGSDGSKPRWQAPPDQSPERERRAKTAVAGAAGPEPGAGATGQNGGGSCRPIRARSGSDGPKPRLRVASPQVGKTRSLCDSARRFIRQGGSPNTPTWGSEMQAPRFRLGALKCGPRASAWGLGNAGPALPLGALKCGRRDFLRQHGSPNTPTCGCERGGDATATCRGPGLPLYRRLHC